MSKSMSKSISKSRAMAIGRVARETGVTVQTIRYYEEIGLLPPPDRTAAGYRQYTGGHLQRLAFIRRCRDLGFHIEDIRTLLEMADHPERPCREIDRLAATHLHEVERRIADLSRLADELRRLATACDQGGTVGECRIIESLSHPPPRA